MSKIISGILLALGIAAFAFFVILIGTFVGGVCGWCVGLFFNQEMFAFKTLIGAPHLTDFQAGALLGFVSSFFKSYSTEKEKS